MVKNMKRKYLDRLDWKRVIQRRYIEKFIDDKYFKGYLSLLYIDKAREPLVVNINQKELILVNDGYKWMQHMPLNKHYAVTTMIDNNNKIIQWYFDIIKGNGIEDGRVYFDDLYLDIVHLPSKETLLLDEDELKDSLENRIITEEDYCLAYNEANKLLAEIERGENHIINSSMVYLDNIMK